MTMRSGNARYSAESVVCRTASSIAARVCLEAREWLRFAESHMWVVDSDQAREICRQLLRAVEAVDIPLRGLEAHKPPKVVQ